MKSTNKRIALDWGKLLGFDQVKSAQASLGSCEAKALVGAKIGTKAGTKGPVTSPIV